MAELTGKELADGIRQRVDELKKVSRGVDEREKWGQIFTGCCPKPLDQDSSCE